MSTVLWILAALVASVVVARVRSLIRPAPFPPWMTPLLESPFRSRERILERSAISKGLRALEIGPGAGWISERAVAELGPDGQLMCLDLQPAMLRKVRARLGERSPWLACASGSALPFRGNAFDRLFVVSVLGEIPDKRGALAEFARVLRPGGVLAVTEAIPDPDYVRTTVLRLLASEAGFAPGECFGNWASYTHRFTRPRTEPARVS